jgi:hypothetical protein
MMLMGIAGAVSEVIASHAMLGLEMSDHGLEIVAATRKWPIQPYCSLVVTPSRDPV